MEWKSDFWEFYLTNKNFVDEIIRAQSYRYQFNYELEDLSQEVLFRLYDNKIMEQYDSNKSSLNTFITNKISYYLSHITHGFGVKNRNPMIFSSDGIQNSMTRVLYKDINSSNETGIPSSLEDQVQFNPLDRVILRENLAVLKERLTPRQWLVFNRILEGQRYSNIAEEIQVSSAWISMGEMPKIKSRMKEIYFNKSSINYKNRHLQKATTKKALRKRVGK